MGDDFIIPIAAKRNGNCLRAEAKVVIRCGRQYPGKYRTCLLAAGHEPAVDDMQDAAARQEGMRGGVGVAEAAARVDQQDRGSEAIERASQIGIGRFMALEQAAYAMGFDHIAAGPLVRSSYHADEHVKQERPGVGPLALAGD